MSVKNINLLQSDITKNISSEQQTEYIQALANLGQRNINQNNGIEYQSFSFLDCFDQFNQFNSDDYIGYIRYFNESYNKKCEFGIVKKENMLSSNFIHQTPFSNIQSMIIDNDLNQIHTFTEDKKYDVQINNIEYYNKHSMIKYKDGYYYTLLFGKIFGSDDYDNNYNIEIIYNKIDAQTNKLVYGLRLFHFIGYEHPVYCLLEIDNDKLRVYKFDLTQLDTNNQIYYIEQLREDFKLFFNNEYYDSENKPKLLKLFKNINIGNIDDITSIDTIFGVILEKNNNVRIYQVGNDIQLNINNENNYLISLDETSYSAFLNNDFYKDKFGITIKDRISYINNDIIYVFPKLEEEYNLYYAANIHKLYQQILLSLFNYFINKYYSIDDLTDSNFNNKSILYIPLNLNIFYYYNSNNYLNIYHIDDLFVNTLNVESYKTQSNFDINIFNQIVFHDTNVLTNQCWYMCLNIQYSKLYKTMITNIDTIIKYALPSIDPTTYNWIINNQNSGISSTLNLNHQYFFFILTDIYKNDNVISGTLLNSLPEPLNNISYSMAEITINPYSLYGKQIDLSNNPSNELICKVAVPNTSDSSLSYLFEHSIVISIIPGENISGANFSKDDNFYFVALFNYDSNDQEYKVITDNNGNPIDLSYLLNFSIATERLKLIPNNVFEYIGLILNKRNLHNNYNNSNNDNILVLFPENDTNITTNTLNDGNDLAFNCKVINNKLNTSQTSLVLDENETFNNIYNQSKYINIISDASNNSSLVINETIDPTTSDILVYDDIIKETKKSSTNETTLNSSDVNITTINTSDITGESISTENEISINNSLGANSTITDYKFNINIPVLNLSEILLSHNNVINRLNILTLDKDSSNNDNYIYNTIIGSELDINNKSVFTIRSSNANIDLGSKTLISNEDRYKFRKQDKILIDFDEIELKSKNFISNTLYNKVETCGNYKFVHHNFSLIGELYDGLSGYQINHETSNHIYQINQFNSYLQINNNLYYDLEITINNIPYYGFNLYKYFVNKNLYDQEEYEHFYQFIIEELDNQNNNIEFEYHNNKDNAVHIGYIMNYNVIYLLIKKEYIHNYNISNTQLLNAKLDIDLIKLISNNNITKYIIQVK